MTWGGVEYAGGPYASPEGAAPATPTATLPTVAAEVAWTTAPNSTSPVFVDISPDFRSVQTVRGRQRELDRYQAGRMDMVLNNRGRSYDPEYADGTYGSYSAGYAGESAFYYPYVKPMRRCRLRATWNAVTYPIFDGYSDQWDQDYHPPREATATLRATDGFKVLTKSQLPVSAFAADLGSATPVLWWRLNEPAGSTTVVDRIAGAAATVYGTPTLGATGLVVNDTDTAMTTALTGHGAAYAASTAIATTYPVTVAVIVHPTGVPPGTMNMVALTDSIGYSHVQLLWDGTRAVFDVRRADGTTATITGGDITTDGNPHLVVGVWDTAGGMTLYVDGISGGTPTALTGTMSPLVRVGIAGTAFESGMSGTIDEAAVFTTALTAAQVVALSAARATPWNGDSPATRLGRVLDLALWPSTQRNLDTGSSVLQTTSLNQTVLDHAQTTADSDFGELFMTRDGQVRFVGRLGLLNRPVAATFGDTAGTEKQYFDVKTDNSDVLIRNPVTIGRTGGVAKTASDATGIGAYLNHQFTLDGLYHNSDTLSADAALFFLSEYKDPKTRVVQLVVKPQRDPTVLWPIVLGAELGDVFTVVRRPQSVGTAISLNCEIQGVAHDVRPGEWTVTFTLSPTYTEAFFQLDLTSGPGLDSLRLYF